MTKQEKDRIERLIKATSSDPRLYAMRLRLEESTRRKRIVTVKYDPIRTVLTVMRENKKTLIGENLVKHGEIKIGEGWLRLHRVLSYLEDQKQSVLFEHRRKKQALIDRITDKLLPEASADTLLMILYLLEGPKDGTLKD